MAAIWAAPAFLAAKSDSLAAGVDNVEVSIATAEEYLVRSITCL